MAEKGGKFSRLSLHCLHNKILNRNKIMNFCDPLQHASMYQRAEEDSDDSDGEGGLGNVSRVIIRPPGHSGKAKRGHLCFDAAFETGNLGRADLIGEFEYDLFLRPDTCNPRYRYWFNFTVDNVKQDQRVIFNIVNISKSRNLFKDGMTPLVKSSARPKWQRLPKTHVFYYKSALHQNHYVLSFSFAFDREDEVYQFALAPPYSYSRMQSYLGLLDVKFNDKFRREVIGQTIQNRKVDLITIDNVAKPIKNLMKDRLRVIVILTRAHPGESPASFVLQGFLEFILGNHTIASILRENFIFKIVPMLNPDGVFLGNNRCNLVGHDLNRCWNSASSWTENELHAAVKMLKELDDSMLYQIDFVIDFHAHSSLLGSFIYGNTYEDVYRYERHLVFPKLLSTMTDDFQLENMMFNADDRKSGSARRFVCEQLSESINSYTLEVSIGGHYLKGSQAMTQYTEEGYMRLGRNVARAFLEYYRFTNVLPTPLIPELSSIKSRPRTHRARSRIRNKVKLRPKTTRAYAPITYKDLSINYESASSNEGSPVRTYGMPACLGNDGGSYGYLFGKRHTGNIYLNPDQLSLFTLHSSNYNNLDIYSDLKPLPANYFTKKKSPAVANIRPRSPETLNIPPKPYLSIIDFNQLTRGGLEEATKINEKLLVKRK